MADNLSKIADLMAMQVTASQSQLHRILDREARLLSLLKELDSHLAEGRRERSTADIVDFQNDLQVRRWVDQRRASVNAELAQTRALVAMAQKQLARQFARQQATEKLLDNRASEAKLAEQRKCYWGS